MKAIDAYILVERDGLFYEVNKETPYTGRMVSFSRKPVILDIGGKKDKEG